MLKATLGILVIAAILCATVPAEAYDCAAAAKRCDEASKAAAIICTLAITEPTPFGELACIAATGYWLAVCDAYYRHCGG